MKCILCEYSTGTHWFTHTYKAKKGWICAECAAPRFLDQLLRLRRRYTKLNKKFKKLVLPA